MERLLHQPLDPSPSPIHIHTCPRTHSTTSFATSCRFCCSTCGSPHLRQPCCQCHRVASGIHSTQAGSSEACDLANASSTQPCLQSCWRARQQRPAPEPPQQRLAWGGLHAQGHATLSACMRQLAR
eukprot:1157325-Pelagomonas_calceolata.AAC.10